MSKWPERSEGLASGSYPGGSPVETAERPLPGENEGPDVFDPFVANLMCELQVSSVIPRGDLERNPVGEARIIPDGHGGDIKPDSGDFDLLSDAIDFVPVAIDDT